MSDNTETDALLTLADRIDEADERPIVIHHGAAAELRRLVAENESLKAELAEQARVNGMGGEREASLMAELERKSDAIQRLWKERDELRSENRTLVRQNGEWQELNAELMEALRNIVQSLSDQDDEGLIEHAEPMVKARAALAKVEASNG